MKNHRFSKRHQDEVLLAGEGELHGLLKACGMTVTEFCELAGIQPSTFYRWYGNPLYQWPTVLLFHIAWARNMGKCLLSRGFDPAYFHPQMPPATKSGRRALEIVLNGLTEEERKRIRHNQAVARGRARWKDRAQKESENPADYSPWNSVFKSG